jgi:hypothetical protein
MKQTTLATFATVMGLLVSGAAFAQSNPNPAGTATAPAAQQPQQTQWAAPDAQSNAGKTRAEVYQELVQAKQDGQLAYLNRTLYAHH